MGETITLRFVAEAKLGSKIIEWWTWCPYSHVGCILPKGLRLPNGYTTRGGEELGSRVKPNGAPMAGVQVRPPYYADFTKTLLATSEMPDASKFYQALFSQIGKPYDTADIIDFALHRKRDWRDTSAWICSELQAWAAEQAGISWLNPKIHVYKLTPRDILLSPALAY